MPEVWRASGGGAGQKEMKLHPLRVCFCWAVPALILTLRADPVRPQRRPDAAAHRAGGGGGDKLKP